MATLPFSEFLDALRDKGLAVGLHEYVALGKLLERWDRTDRDEIRNGLAALIARNEDEVQEISEAFDKFYPLAPPPKPPGGGEKGGQQQFNLVALLRRSAPWAALLVVLTIGGYVAVSRSRIKVEPVTPVPTVQAPPPGPSTGGGTTTPTPSPTPAAVLAPSEPGLTDPRRGVQWAAVSWLAVAAGILSVVALWGARMRERARQWIAESWRSELAQLPGPFHPALVLKDFISRLPRADIDDAATVLSRSFSSDWRGTELDVQRSLRETLRFGMQPHLTFRPRRVQEAILVLQDISQSMAVHARKVDSLNSDLRRQGVVLEHWFFDGDVALPARRPFGVPVPLAQLFRSRGDGPTLILSAGAGVPASMARPETDWLIALRNRSRKAWVNPITDPQLWPAAMQRLPVVIFPMTRKGLLHAANALAHDDYPAPHALSRMLQSKPVTPAHIQQLRRLASVVPYPTPEFLELLRQRFAPAIPESAVLYAVDARSASANLPFKMTDDEIRESLLNMRSETAELERQVREYLIKVLDDSEPQRDSVAHLRWQASRAVHQLQLAELRGASPVAAIETLRLLYNGPLWEEVRSIVNRQPATSPAMNQLSASVGGAGRKTGAPDFVSRPDRPAAVPFRWVTPGWRAIVAGATMAAIVAIAAPLTSPFQLQASNDPRAFSLEYIAPAYGTGSGQLSIRANGDSPGRQQTVQLLRDGTPWGNPLTLSGNTAGTMPIDESQVYVYQARAARAGGAVAVSNSIFAPSVQVTIDAQPWARVSVTFTDRKEQKPLTDLPTPLTIGLPPGNYELRLQNDGINPEMTQRIIVPREGQREFRFTMPGFNVDDLVRRLGSAGRASAKY